jgi:hypothetical protein
MIHKYHSILAIVIDALKMRYNSAIVISKSQEKVNNGFTSIINILSNLNIEYKTYGLQKISFQDRTLYFSTLSNLADGSKINGLRVDRILLDDSQPYDYEILQTVCMGLTAVHTK